MIWTSGGLVDFSTPNLDAMAERLEELKRAHPAKTREMYQQQPIIDSSPAPKRPVDPALAEKLKRFDERMKLR